MKCVVLVRAIVLPLSVVQDFSSLTADLQSSGRKRQTGPERRSPIWGIVNPGRVISTVRRLRRGPIDCRDVRPSTASFRSPSPARFLPLAEVRFSPHKNGQHSSAFRRQSVATCQPLSVFTTESTTLGGLT
jgi:hypothetical protein